MMSRFTKSGFSRDFGCCSHWKKCEMGKKTCVYQEMDPETMESCAAWRRVQKQSRHVTAILSSLPEEVTEPIRPVIAKEQLTLF